MRYPKNLKNSISFIAPSFGCTFDPYKTRLENAINKLNNYDIKVYDNCNKSILPFRSNTDLSCALEFTSAYKDEFDVVWSVGGGECMVEILDHIDFNEISNLEPKWFIGYSDNTNLTFLLTTLCDTASIYGPNAPDLGLDNNHQCITDTFDIITNNNLLLNSYDMYESLNAKRINPLDSLILDTKNKYTINKETTIEGRLIGGCLDIICNLIGTKYDKVNEFLEKYKNDGIIWFLEACDLNVMDVRRAFKQMENSGYFKYVKGFIIGKPLITEESFGLNHLNCLDDILNKYDVLVIKDADLGHIKPSMPIICGAIGEITTSNNSYKINYKLR